MYLWHWPIFFALRRLDLATPKGYIVAILIAIALSALTYLYTTDRLDALRCRRGARCFCS
jgi:peptidoglycan/LPS O-acetylase OafA/YrhL